MKLGAELVGADKHAADEAIPILTIREYSAAEVEAIRQAQREKQANTGADLDPDEIAALRGESDEAVVAEESDPEIVAEE